MRLIAPRWMVPVSAVSLSLSSAISLGPSLVRGVYAMPDIRPLSLRCRPLFFILSSLE